MYCGFLDYCTKLQCKSGVLYKLHFATLFLIADSVYSHCTAFSNINLFYVSWKQKWHSVLPGNYVNWFCNISIRQFHFIKSSNILENHIYIFQKILLSANSLAALLFLNKGIYDHEKFKAFKYLLPANFSNSTSNIRIHQDDYQRHKY